VHIETLKQTLLPFSPFTTLIHELSVQIVKLFPYFLFWAFRLSFWFA